VIEPFIELSGGRFVAGHGEALNPDPLRDYVWNLTGMPNASALQLLRVLPAAVQTSPGSNFTDEATLVNSTAASARAQGGGTLVLDYGVELAAWIELRSPDLTAAAVAAGCVTMSVGESNVPQFFSPSRLSPKVHNATNPLFAGWKTAVPAQYAGGVFRLELNAQLYEGVRYGFLHVNASCGRFEPFTIASVAAQAQVKPANWEGTFSAPGFPVLERAWYVGGYTVKLNLQEDAIGSILDQRGDRTPKGVFAGFSGDAHPAQATSMAAFGNFELVKAMQQQLGQFDSSYGTYCMYWVLSLADYFAATADAPSVKAMLPQAHEKMLRSLHRATPTPGAPPTQRQQYAGWDERFNFAKPPVYPENGYVMRALYVQASAALAEVAQAVGNRTLAAAYRAEAAAMRARVRGGAGGEAERGNEWWRPLGLHASAHAANAGLINATEAPLVFAARFNDSASICSFSNFNQYFVLQGLAKLGYPRQALASIELCWGAELALGATSFWEVSGYGGQWAHAFGGAHSPAGAAAFSPLQASPPAPLQASPPVPGHSSGSDSKCHPGASGVTAWLSQEAAGLRTRPCPAGGDSGDGGRSSFALCASVRPLLARVSASLPTPRGPLKVSIDAAAGIHSLSVPCGVFLTDLQLPLSAACSARPASVSVSVSVSWLHANATTEAGARAGAEHGASPGPNRSGAEHGAAYAEVESAVVAAPWESANGLFDRLVHIANQSILAAASAAAFEGEGEGVCSSARPLLRVRVRCAGAADAEATEATEAAAAPGRRGRSLATAYGAPQWAVPLVGSDSATQGAWIGRYGARGHRLFGLDNPSASNLSAPFLGAVSIQAGAERVVADPVPSGDLKYAAALQLPCAGCARALGNASSAFLQPMAIEVGLRPALLPETANGRCCNLSLYFVDWAGADPPVQGWGGGVRRKTAVDVFTVTPEVEIDVGHATAVAEHPLLAGGVYRTWRACASRLRANATTGLAAVRFRVYVVTGKDAAVSALFID
jgi:hypothetical protein